MNQGLIPKRQRKKCPYCGTFHWYRSAENKCIQTSAGRTKQGVKTALSNEKFFAHVRNDFISHDDKDIRIKHEAEQEILADAIAERKSQGTTRREGNVVRVAYDLDGVCADLNTYLAPYGGRNWEISPATYDFVRSGWFTGWGQKKGEFGLYHDEVMHRAYDIPINDHSIVESMQKLHDHSNKGGPEYEIFFLTDRPQFAHASSVEFLRRAGVNMDNHELIITGGKKKSTFKPDYLVDDAPKNILDMYKNSPTATGVTYAQPYNDHLHGIAPRIRNLVDYADFIIQREQELSTKR